MADALLRKLWSVNSDESAVRLMQSGDVDIFHLRNLIGGSFEEPKGADFISSYNPKTGEIFAKVPSSTDHEVHEAVQAATETFKVWSKTPKSKRSMLLARIADLIAERKDTLAAWESIDQGKTFARARVEVERAESNFRYFAGYILHDEGAARFTDDDHLTYEHRSPLGVFGLISPWNMPLYLLTWKIAPCIAFGCTAVAKPSELTSVTAFLLADIFRQAELPAGVMNIVFGAGKPTGSAIVQHPNVRGISFTGGTATGKQIRRDTIDDIGKHLSLELGGKNPTLVFADVDLEAAVKTAAAAAFENQGEICLCGSRIYVEASIYEGFLSRFVSYVGSNYTVGGKVGAVISLTHYQKVRSYLELAQAEGATFELGEVPEEQPSRGYWVKPTILTGVAINSAVMRYEIFGPVVTIAKFSTEDQAVHLANDNPNGLAAILLTKDGNRMRRVGEQLDAGMVWINSWLVRQLATPFGGMKQSGTGREGGAYSRDVFTNVRTIHMPI